MTDKKYGKWVAGEKIGDGGQGDVYLTYDNVGKKYAIKVVKVKPTDKKKLARIKSEIEIIKQLKNEPNIIKIHDDNIDSLKEDSQTGQTAFYVMDYAPYGNLQKNDFYLNDVELGLRLFLEILKGVEAAHKAGVIHRDLKPENILLYPTQRSIAISDFGLGLLLDADRTPISDPDEVLGPKHFIAPEQHKKSSAANERSDIYSLGKILYFLLTGKGRVFREEIGDVTKEFTGDSPYLPLVQEKLLDKMVAFDSSKRFSSVSEAIEEVESILRQISSNSQRFVSKRNDKGFSIYDVVVAGRRQEFIDKFSKDLAFSMDVLQWVATELYQENKQALLEQLKKELLTSYPKGKSNALAQAAFMFVEKPDDLKQHENGRYSFAAYYMAKYFEDAGSHELAHQHLNIALTKETDSSITLQYLLLLSDIGKQCSCTLPHDFDQRIKNLMNSTPDHDKKAKLYKILGEHYMETGDKAQGLRFLESYLILKPYDNDIRFTVAHAYSEMKQRALAHHHYQLHLKTGRRATGKDNPDVQNNLGVIYINNDMDIKGLELYKEAYSAGSTLSGSNIASRYLSIGMVDEAEKILRQIIADNPSGDYDKRVDEVLGSITSVRTSEDDTLKLLEEHGASISHHNSESVNALSLRAMSWEGFWKFNTSPVLEIKLENNVLRAARRDDKTKTVELLFDGNVAMVSKMDVGSYDTYDFGVLYLINSNEFQGYLLKSGKEFLQVTGTKIPDIDAYDKEANWGLRALLEGKMPK